MLPPCSPFSPNLPYRHGLNRYGNANCLPRVVASIIAAVFYMWLRYVTIIFCLSAALLVGARTSVAYDGMMKGAPSSNHHVDGGKRLLHTEKDVGGASSLDLM